MATANTKYGSVTAFTITLASLASYGAREGTAVSNTANLYLDAIFSGKITVGAAAATGDCHILLGSFDSNNYAYPLTGADANVTLQGKSITCLDSLQYGMPVPGTGLIYLCRVPTYGVAAATAVPFQSLSISQAFQIGGLALPESFSPVVVNCQGQAFDATAGHFAIFYTGITQTIA
jgi:hypothetical protein